MTSALDRRLGLRLVVDDHVQTWSVRTGPKRTRDRRQAAVWYYGVPLVLAAPLLRWHVEVQGVGQLLSGVAVFTALLFGLLVLMFNTGLALRKDAKALANAHDTARVIADARANTTYAAVVAVVLAMTLVVAAALTPPVEGLAWGWAPVLVFLFSHLALTLLTILGRFRTAFNYLTR
jgi:hypothetical protein